MVRQNVLGMMTAIGLDQDYGHRVRRCKIAAGLRHLRAGHGVAGWLKLCKAMTCLRDLE